MKIKSGDSKQLSTLSLGILGFLLGILLYPIIFHVPHGVKITKVISNHQLVNNPNIVSTSSQYLFENYDNLEPVIITGASEMNQAKSSLSGNKGKVAISTTSLENLQYVLNANLYAKFSEYSSVYSTKKAETIYSIDKILGKEGQKTFLPTRVERFEVDGRVKSIAQGSFSKKNKGRMYIAMLTDAFEVVLVDRDSRELVWRVDFKDYIDTSKVQNIDEYVVSLQIVPKSEKDRQQEAGAGKGGPQGPPTEEGIYPGGKEKKGIVFAVWKIRLQPDMFGNRFVLLLAAMDGKTGAVKWASVAETLDSDSNSVVRKLNPEPVYFNLGEDADGKNDDPESVATKTETREMSSRDKNRVDIIGILSHMAACRLPMNSNSNALDGSTNSVILGVSAKKYTTKNINKRSNTNAANKKSNKSTFREIVEASNSGNTELSYKSDTLLFISPSHIIAADFDKGKYLFGAILQKGTLLFSVGGIPYAFYTVSSCNSSSTMISGGARNTPGNNNTNTPGSVGTERACAVLAEVNPTDQLVNKIHWAVTLEDGVVSKKMKAKKTAAGKNVKTFTGNLIDTPIKPLIFQENVFTPPKLVVLSPTGYLHCYDLNGNTLWARPAKCGDGSTSSLITTDRVNSSAGDYVSLSAQQVSGKSVVVTVCGGNISMIWADSGEVAGQVQLEDNFVSSAGESGDRQVISSVTFSQVAPAPSAPIVSIVKAKIPTQSNGAEAEQSQQATPLLSSNYYLDIYALSGFDGNASSSFFYTICCVLVAGLLGMILVSSFPPPSVKLD